MHGIIRKSPVRGMNPPENHRLSAMKQPSRGSKMGGKTTLTGEIAVTSLCRRRIAAKNVPAFVPTGDFLGPREVCHG
jgi:hypothetical protein